MVEVQEKNTIIFKFLDEVLLIAHLNLEAFVLEKSSCTLNMAENKRSLCDPAELLRR